MTCFVARKRERERTPQRLRALERLGGARSVVAWACPGRRDLLPPQARRRREKRWCRGEAGRTRDFFSWQENPTAGTQPGAPLTPGRYSGCTFAPLSRSRLSLACSLSLEQGRAGALFGTHTERRGRRVRGDAAPSPMPCRRSAAAAAAVAGLLLVVVGLATLMTRPAGEGGWRAYGGGVGARRHTPRERGNHCRHPPALPLTFPSPPVPLPAGLAAHAAWARTVRPHARLPPQAPAKAEDARPPGHRWAPFLTVPDSPSARAADAAARAVVAARRRVAPSPPPPLRGVDGVALVAPTQSGAARAGLTWRPHWPHWWPWPPRPPWRPWRPRSRTPSACTPACCAA